MLADDRRQGVLKKLKDYGQDHLDPSPIECTEFCDKRDLTRALCGFGKAFLRDLKRIEQLRNAVAHAGSYAGNEAELKKFVDHNRRVRGSDDGGAAQDRRASGEQLSVVCSISIMLNLVACRLATLHPWPFQYEPDFAAATVNFNLSKLLPNAEASG